MQNDTEAKIKHALQQNIDSCHYNMYHSLAFFIIQLMHHHSSDRSHARHCDPGSMQYHMYHSASWFSGPMSEGKGYSVFILLLIVLLQLARRGGWKSSALNATFPCACIAWGFPRWRWRWSSTNSLDGPRMNRRRLWVLSTPDSVKSK